MTLVACQGAVGLVAAWRVVGRTCSGQLWGCTRELGVALEFFPRAVNSEWKVGGGGRPAAWPTSKRVVILWMDESLHHFETTGIHCWLVFTRESGFAGFSGGAEFRPSTV